MTDEGREPWASYIDLLIEEIDKIAGRWRGGNGTRLAMRNAYLKKHDFSINISFCLKVRHPILSYSIHWLIIKFPIQLFFWGRGGGIPHVQTNNDKPIKQQKMRFVVRMVLSKYINKKSNVLPVK